MGLDIYIHENEESSPKRKEIGYWRKRWDLFYWFSQFDPQSLEGEDDFELTLESITGLHTALLDRQTKYCDPLFYDYNEECRQYDFNFIYKAKRKLKQGKRLFLCASW